MRRKNQQEKGDEIREEPVDMKTALGTSRSGRGEKRTVTQENVPVKKRLVTKSPKRLATLLSLLDDPVKRRLLKKNRLAEQRRALGSRNQRHGSAGHGEHTSEC